MLDINQTLTIIIVTVTILIVIKKCYSKLKPKSNTITENFSEDKYLKFSETKVPINDNQKIIEGNIEQCQAECNLDKECVGFVREKKAPSVNAKCHIIKNIVNCHNEFKEPSDNYVLAPGISNENNYYDYNTYLKLDVNDMQKDEIQKCIRLKQNIGIVPRRYPFSILVLDENYNLKVVTKEKKVLNLEEQDEDNFYSKYTVVNLVKGLTGSGVSFKINKDNSDYYVCINKEGENLSCLLEDNDIQFKRKATFKLDMEYSEEELINEDSNVKFLSIKNELKGVTTYWKVDNVTHKIISIKKDNIGEDLEDIMFKFISPLKFNEEKKKEIIEKEEFPEPSVSDNNEFVELQSMKNMNEELDKLELDIREAQHKQNLKLMNIMLDVNKFKLHDISMSGYLKKCLNDTPEKKPSYIDKQIGGDLTYSGAPQVSL